MLKKKSKPKAAQAVEGAIVKIEIDCSSWIGDVPFEQWTRGPILPVGGEQRSTKNGKRDAKGGKKRA